MSGVSAQVLSHVVRRHVSSYNGQSPADAAAALYGGREEDLLDFQFSGFAIFSLISLFVITVLVVLSVDYTVGTLMTTLAMVESSSTTTIIESHPPAYTDEPDAPLEKKPLLDETDVEIVTIKHKPITTSIKSTIKHLHRVGGFRARWRGLGQNILYHAALNIVGHGFGNLFFRHSSPLLSHGMGLFIATMLLCRVHMLSTHAMIGAPTSIPWYRRFVARSRRVRVVLLPTLVYALTRHVAIFASFAVWSLFNLADRDAFNPDGLTHASGAELALFALKVLSGPVASFLVVLFVTLPAEAALIRVEACLLPEEHDTIVPFDRDAIVGDLDLNVKGAPGKLFSSAWKSFSFAARLRVVKLYVKLFLFQLSFVITSALIALGIVYVSNPERCYVLAMMLLV